MKERYEDVKLEVINFSADDIICASDPELCGSGENETEEQEL